MKMARGEAGPSRQMAWRLEHVQSSGLFGMLEVIGEGDASRQSGEWM